MQIPLSAFPYNHPRSFEYDVINTIIVKNNQLVENFFKDHKTGVYANWKITDRKGNSIIVDETDCEWLSPTFFRNKDELYGLSLIIKSNSTKLFLTKVRAKVDFKTFTPISKYYAKDKNRYYYGPGGKTIKENHLDVYFDDSYKNEWYKIRPDKKRDSILYLWDSYVAKSKDKVYWRGRVLKEAHISLKQITRYSWADDFSVYENASSLKPKKIEKVDRESLVYMNIIKPNSIKGLITDKYKPVYRYLYNDTLNKKQAEFDFKEHTPLFEKYRGSISQDYWWYKMERDI